MSRLGVTQAGTVCPGARRISGSVGPRPAAAGAMLTTTARSALICRADRVRRGDIGALSCAGALALRAELEGLVEGLSLARVLAGDGTFLRVGGDEGVGFALFCAFVDVEHGVIHHLVDDRTNNERLLPAVARGPHPALLAGHRWRRWGSLNERLSSTAGRRHLELLFLACWFVGSRLLGR